MFVNRVGGTRWKSNRNIVDGWLVVRLWNHIPLDPYVPVNKLINKLKPQIKNSKPEILTLIEGSPNSHPASQPPRTATFCSTGSTVDC